MDRHVIALFYEPDQAAQAMEALVEEGVAPGEISLFSTEQGMAKCRQSRPHRVKEGATQGGIAGSAIAVGGGVIALGSGGSAILAVGPLLLAAMMGFGFGATIGGIVAALTRIGLPEPIAGSFEEEVCKSGAVLLGVATLRHDDGRVAALLRRQGGASVMSTAAPVFSC